MLEKQINKVEISPKPIESLKRIVYLEIKVGEDSPPSASRTNLNTIALISVQSVEPVLKLGFSSRKNIPCLQNRLPIRVELIHDKRRLDGEPVRCLISYRKSKQTSPLSPVPPVPPSASPMLLSLSFNGYNFFPLSDIIAHITDYPVSLERVKLYCDVVEQTAAIFDIGSILAAGLRA